MGQNYEAGNSSNGDATARNRRNRGDRGHGDNAHFPTPHAVEKHEKISPLKLWGVTQEVLRSLGFFFVQDEFMHLGFNEEKIPVELRPHLPPLTASLNPQRTADEPSAAQQQMELLNKRLHALKPGTLLSLDGQFRFHMDDENFPSSFQELLALRDVRFRGAGGHQSEEE